MVKDELVKERKKKMRAKSLIKNIYLFDVSTHTSQVHERVGNNNNNGVSVDLLECFEFKDLK
jgi:hypothetical protein